MSLLPSSGETVSRLYLHPQRGWVPDPDGAVLRLDAAALRRHVYESRNVVYRPDGKGGWQAVVDEATLSATERGLIWETWRAAVDGDDYLAFRGVRAVDGEMAQTLLKGLPVRDEEGLILTEPLRAGRVFLLDEAGAVEFARRVKELGGAIGWGSPLSEGTQGLLARLEELGARVADERRTDADALTAARAGNLTGVQSFEGRTKAFLALCADVFEAYNSCRRSVQHLRAQGRSAGEREEASAALREARAIREQTAVAREERDEDAAELAFLAGRGRGHHETPPLGPRLAARAVGRLAAQAGYETSEEDGTTVIHLPGATLLLGDRFDYAVDEAGEAGPAGRA